MERAYWTTQWRFNPVLTARRPEDLKPLGLATPLLTLSAFAGWHSHSTYLPTRNPEETLYLRRVVRAETQSDGSIRAPAHLSLYLLCAVKLATRLGLRQPIITQNLRSSQGCMQPGLHPCTQRRRNILAGHVGRRRTSLPFGGREQRILCFEHFGTFESSLFLSSSVTSATRLPILIFS